MTEFFLYVACAAAGLLLALGIFMAAVIGHAIIHDAGVVVEIVKSRSKEGREQCQSSLPQ